MRNKNDDRRVKYTKMVLKQSLIKLLTQKNISQLTVKEICEDADINRSTFYAHYADQFDLMHKIEDELLLNVGMYLAEYTQNVKNFDRIEMVEKIFEYIKQNASLCKLMLSEKGDLNFQKKIMMMIYEKNINDLMRGSVMTKETAEYVYSFTITGCVGVIQKWLNDGMKESTRSMAEMLIKLTMI